MGLREGVSSGKACGARGSAASLVNIISVEALGFKACVAICEGRRRVVLVFGPVLRCL